MVVTNKANEPESCLEQRTNRTYQFLLEPPQTRVHAPRFRLGELLLHIVLFFLFIVLFSLSLCVFQSSNNLRLDASVGSGYQRCLRGGRDAGSAPMESARSSADAQKSCGGMRAALLIIRILG